MSSEEIVTAVYTATQKLFEGLPEHHGWPHVKAVYENTCEALKHGSYTDDQSLKLRLAALLHDADDDKIFPGLIRGPIKRSAFSSAHLAPMSHFPNAHHVLKDCQVPYKLWADIDEIISLVSTSTQAAEEDRLNYIYDGDEIPQWLFVARDADRLEAIGAVGFKRVIDYNTEVGKPMWTMGTPLPIWRGYSMADKAGLVIPHSGRRSVETDIPAWLARELESEAFHARWPAYLGGRKSASAIDHFFDKLLHLDCADAGNMWLIERAKERRAEMMPPFVELLEKAAKEHLHLTRKQVAE